MKFKETLRPTKRELVMNLAAAAGVNVSSWSRSKRGRVKHPASNPAYCYEWAFIEPGQTVVVNLWHDAIKERRGQLFCDLNLRKQAETVRQSSLLKPSQRSASSRRAFTMDKALSYAYENQLPVRAIIGDGPRRDLSYLKSLKASQMKYRLLDQVAWSVQQYDHSTGKCHLSRGTSPRFVDQFSTEDEHAPKQHEVIGKIWERNPCVREAVLLRANGICEICREPGFKTSAGLIYLETHHVIPLSQGGHDHQRNVAAICPNDHRRAHHGEYRDKMRNQMLTMLAKIYGR
jgi:predicted HNH restriction endonuclease